MFRKILLFSACSIFLSPLMLEESQRNSLFKFARLASTAGYMAFLYKTSDNCHKQAAESLLNCFQRNGGLFIKFGQLVAALDLVVPEQYRKVFLTIFKGSQSMNIQDIRQVFLEQIKIPLEEIFDTDSFQFINSASIAQVYSARLKDGTKVAVKLQHKGLQQACHSDIRMIKFFINLGQRIFSDFKFAWFGNELERVVPQQLDFRIQGANSLQASRRYTKHGIKIPKYYSHLSGKRLMVSQFIEGKRLDQCIKGLSSAEKRRISHTISKLFSDMIFQSGFVHADPHMANFIVESSTGRLTVLDHALYQRLDKKTKQSYALLWHGMVTQNEKEIKESCSLLGDNMDYRIFSAMVSAKDYDTLMGQGEVEQRMINRTIEDSQRVQRHAAAFAKEITRTLHSMNSSLLLVFKVNEFVKHIGQELERPGEHLVEAIKSCNRSLGRAGWSEVWEQTKVRLGVALGLV